MNASSPRAPITFPLPRIGVNNDPDALVHSCPSRQYHRCFAHELRRRYPVTQFGKRHRPFRCYEEGAEAVHSECRPVGEDEVPRVARGGAALHTCAAPPQPIAASQQPPTIEAPLRCNSDPAKVQSRAVLLLGVPSSPSAKGRKRRDAIRASWMRDPLVGQEVIVCFLLSAQTPAEAHLEAEAALHGDVLLVDAPETPWIIKSATRYSNGTKRGRGMPTFKQHRFFQLAASRWPAIPFVGKIDDDTIPNTRLLLPFLRSLRCATPNFLFIGAINWAGVVPRAVREGVRADRCGFAWDMIGALSNFGKSWGTRGIARGRGRYMEACDARGAVLPVPYAAGAGYIFSAPLLHWLASSDAVSGWVAEARGADREALQWQKFEDTSTGYWLSYAPSTVHYVDIAPLTHDIDCHPEGRRLRDGEGTYRPPANSSVLVHNLKTPSAFAYAHAHMRGAALPYDHNECMHGVRGAPLLDPSVLLQRERERSGQLWARAANGERQRLQSQHNVYLRSALTDAGLACAKCRKKEMAELMLSTAAHLCHAAQQRQPRGRAALSECLGRVAQHQRTRGAGRATIREHGRTL